MKYKRIQGEELIGVAYGATELKLVVEYLNDLPFKLFTAGLVTGILLPRALGVTCIEDVRRELDLHLREKRGKKYYFPFISS